MSEKNVLEIAKKLKHGEIDDSDYEKANALISDITHLFFEKKVERHIGYMTVLIILGLIQDEIQAGNY